MSHPASFAYVSGVATPENVGQTHVPTAVGNSEPLSSIGLAKDDPASSPVAKRLDEPAILSAVGPAKAEGPATAGPSHFHFHRALRAYFRSGWAFLLPYLALYLLYYWAKWPANGFAPSAWGNGGHIPALLHVFWVLHFLHATLAVIALHSWWRSASEKSVKTDSENTTPVIVATSTLNLNRSTGSSCQFPDTLSTQSSALGLKAAKSRPEISNVLHALAPWLMLALLLAIPGVYLEWPSDPWEHIFRINEWPHIANISDKLMSKNYAYFLAYSFLRGSSGVATLTHAYAYQTALSLLLCWQYYLLARATGLSRQSSTIFVILQAVLLGNNVFSFYRYYGLASTVLAHIGAIAALRITISSLNRCDPLPQGNQWANGIKYLLLLALILANHIQGLAIAAMGIAAVLIHSCSIRCKGRTLLGLAVVFVALNAGVFMWFRSEPSLEGLVRSGWLAEWLGFNILVPASPANLRTVEILGLFGLINLGAAFLLIRSHRLIACLTILPVAALALPAVGIAFAFATKQGENIALFHRLLLGVPCGLAVIAAGAPLFRASGGAPSSRASYPARIVPWLHAIRPHILVIGLAALVLTPSSYPSFGRLWNALQIVPTDLRQKDITDAYADTSTPNTRPPPGTTLLTPRYVGFVALATGHPQKQHLRGYRSFIPNSIPSSEADTLLAMINLSSQQSAGSLVLIPSPLELFSTTSLTGFLSRHWSPHQVHLERIAAAEACALSEIVGKPVENRAAKTFMLGRP